MTAQIFRIELYSERCEQQLHDLSTYLTAHAKDVIKTSELVVNDVLVVVVYVAREGQE